MAKVNEAQTKNGHDSATLAGLDSTGIREVLSDYNADISRLTLGGSKEERRARAERVVAIVTNVIRRNTKLMECTKETIVGSIMRCVILGLDATPELGECYLIPRKNKKRGGVMECNFEVGYKGYISMAFYTGQFKSVSARFVRENDFFQYEYGLIEKCVHRVGGLSLEKGKLTHVYVVWEFLNGGKYFEVMDEDEINAVKNVSQAKDSDFSPWNVEEWVPDMWRKSVIKKSRKYIPLATESVKKFVRNLAIDDVAHTPDDFRDLNYLDPALDAIPEKTPVKAPEIPPKDPAGELRDTKTDPNKSLGDANAQPPGD